VGQVRHVLKTTGRERFRRWVVADTRSIPEREAGGQQAIKRFGVAPAGPRCYALTLEASSSRTTRKTPGASSRPVAESDASLAGCRVLLVNDEPDRRDLLEILLIQAGATVVAVGSVKEALKRLPMTRAHVIVSDIARPGASGEPPETLSSRSPVEQGARSDHRSAVLLRARKR
jgi:hypothetical protein